MMQLQIVTLVYGTDNTRIHILNEILDLKGILELTENNKSQKINKGHYYIIFIPWEKKT